MFGEGRANEKKDWFLFYSIRLPTSRLFAVKVRKHRVSRPSEIVSISACTMSYPFINSSVAVLETGPFLSNYRKADLKSHFFSWWETFSNF